MRFSAFQSLQLCTWFYSQADCTCLVAAWIFVYEPSLPVALAASCPSMCFWIFGALTCWLLFQTSLEGARASVCQKRTRGRKKEKSLLSKTLVSFFRVQRQTLFRSCVLRQTTSDLKILNVVLKWMSRNFAL